MKYIFKNNAESTLAAAIGATDITLDVDSGDGAKFPSPGSGEGFHFLVTQGSKEEWMVGTARSTDRITMTRGSSPQSFTAGAVISHRLHADALNAMLQKGVERTVTEDPDGSLAANYFSEEVYQSETGVWWKHCNGTTWKEMNS